MTFEMLIYEIWSRRVMSLSDPTAQWVEWRHPVKRSGSNRPIASSWSRETPTYHEVDVEQIRRDSTHSNTKFDENYIGPTNGTHEKRLLKIRMPQGFALNALRHHNASSQRMRIGDTPKDYKWQVQAVMEMFRIDIAYFISRLSLFVYFRLQVSTREIYT